ncbi:MULTISPECIES: DUF3618 domain-containing protein [unclassified Streptomyces]|uniref:DUF3618 domain-containing protein n=1 Tax=unclassified Streptomyces TaxID=2593676 RepID=UPI000DC7E00A|nr:MULTISPECIES: DUF3618 domain-containing protein [unclassified Streptomyces]AWZ03922.1 hypothetical protein DRB89_03915 [Streptomyces sp. ICC4]AWZ13039.1 hypothetical protein DRB96_12750 [Streptomyces sp. ICC1]
MKNHSRSNGFTSSLSPGELRHRMEHTRAGLTRTVEALAGGTDVKAQAKETAAHAVEAAAAVKEQAARLVRGKTAEPVLDTAGQVATTARANRVPLIAFGVVLAVILWVRHGRGHK